MLLFYIYLAAFFFFLVSTACYLFYFFKNKKKSFFQVFFLIILTLFLLEITVFEPYCLKIRRETVIINKLQKEIKIALISDLHLRPLKSSWLIEKASQMIKEKQPDLILLAGDNLFLDHVDNFKKALKELKLVSAIAPTYAVLGNHDYGIGDVNHKYLYNDQHEKITKILEEVGVKILKDQKEKINLNGQNFWLVGFDEYWKLDSNPGQILSGFNDNLLKIGLSHNPDNGFLPQSKILDILLSGHSHGGQIRLPFLGPLGNAETIFPKQNYGRLVTAQQPKMLNTSGLGESGLPIRFFNRPEIVILTIK